MNQPIDRDITITLNLLGNKYSPTDWTKFGIITNLHVEMSEPRERVHLHHHLLKSSVEDKPTHETHRSH